MRHITPITSWHLMAGVRTSGLPNDPASPFPPDYALLAGIAEPIHFLMKDGQHILKWDSDSVPPPWADIVKDAEDMVSRYVPIDEDQPVWATPYYPLNDWKELVDLNVRPFIQGAGIAVRITAKTRALINTELLPDALREPYLATKHNIRMAYDRMASLRTDNHALPVQINTVQQLVTLYMGSALIKNADMLTKAGAFEPSGLKRTKEHVGECFMTTQGLMAYRDKHIQPSYDIQGIKHMRSDGSHAQSAFRVRAYFDMPIFDRHGTRLMVIEVPAYRMVAYAHEQALGQAGIIGETFDVFPQNGRLDDPSLDNLIILPTGTTDWSKTPELPRFNHTDLRMVYSERIPQAQWLDMMIESPVTKAMDISLFETDYERPARSKPGPKGPRNEAVRHIVAPTDAEISKSKVSGAGLNAVARPIIATPVTLTAQERTKDGMPVVLPSIGNAAKYGFTKTAVHRCLRGKQSEHKGFKFTYVGESNESLPVY